MTIKPDQSPHGNDPHRASHPSWELRRESAIWVDGVASEPNLIPHASQMCGWLGQRAQLTIIGEHERRHPKGPTNPHSYHASTIGLALAQTICSTFNFIESASEVDPTEAEIERVRLHHELVLYAARFCEATVKQMLFCTTLKPRFYKHSSLGHLLSFDCQKCRKGGLPTHGVSMLGALAHRYHQCDALDGCVFDHLQLVNRRRNVEAAHSDTLTLNVRTAEASREDLSQALKRICQEFGHMCEHIGDIEGAMLKEINLHIAHQPDPPPLEELAKIPVLPPELRWPPRHRPHHEV